MVWGWDPTENKRCDGVSADLKGPMGVTEHWRSTESGQGTAFRRSHCVSHGLKWEVQAKKGMQVGGGSMRSGWSRRYRRG